MNENFRERLIKALNKSNLTQSELSRRAGVHKSSLSAWIKGDYEPKQDNVYRLAKALNVSEAWLMGIAEDYKPHNRLVPITGNIAAGTPNISVEDIIGYMSAPPDRNKTEGLMYLKVISDSMDKKISEGSYALVDTTADVENGNIAVVKINGDEATLKQVKFGDDKKSVMLIPDSHNPNHFPVLLDVEKDEVYIVGKVIGVYQSI